MPVTTPEKTVDNENAAEKAADDAEVDEKIVDDADSEAENVSKEKADATGQDAPAKADKTVSECGCHDRTGNRYFPRTLFIDRFVFTGIYELRRD